MCEYLASILRQLSIQEIQILCFSTTQGHIKMSMMPVTQITSHCYCIQRSRMQREDWAHSQRTEATVMHCTWTTTDLLALAYQQLFITFTYDTSHNVYITSLTSTASQALVCSKLYIQAYIACFFGDRAFWTYDTFNPFFFCLQVDNFMGLKWNKWTLDKVWSNGK